MYIIGYVSASIKRAWDAFAGYTGNEAITTLDCDDRGFQANWRPPIQLAKGTRHGIHTHLSGMCLPGRAHRLNVLGQVLAGAISQLHFCRTGSSSSYEYIRAGGGSTAAKLVIYFAITWSSNAP